MNNDWMQQEVSRQAAESGDPAAQTSSWMRPAPSERRPRSSRLVAIGVAVLIAALAVVLARALL